MRVVYMSCVDAVLASELDGCGLHPDRDFNANCSICGPVL